MEKERIAWIRRRTTAEDLLDDGIENNSAVFLSTDSDMPETPEERKSNTIRDQALLAAKIDYERKRDEFRSKSYSGLGLFLATILMSGGLYGILYPAELYVTHVRVKYLPTFVEHVTPDIARFYGISLFLCGIATAVFSIYRPKK
ncbi:MAG TPA: hypothetical protein VN248_07525 [Arenimonas sp.]|nr:hypothetical protein [Arenimonas sp.]